MPKPCGHADDRAEPECRSCMLAETDPKYRRHWGLGEKVAPRAPGFWAKAAGLGKAVLEHVAHGWRTLPAAETQARLAVCAACQQYQAADRSCLLCGCNLPVKASWVEQRCPEGRWPGEGGAAVPIGVQLEVSADGIGDHLLALTVAHSWKLAHPGQDLTLVVRHRQWVELFEGYDQLADAIVPGLPHIHPELTARGGLHFAEVAARVPGCVPPPVRVLPAEATAWAEQFRRCVVLAPLSLGSGAGRNWLLSHWLHLERLLAERGVPCVIIAAGDEAHRLTAFRSRTVCGEPAARVAALMRVATAVVANESGMGHLAGALGVPCVVLAAQLQGAEIHGIWPQTTVIQGPLPCTACRWGGPHFRAVACHAVCAALQAITPEMVLGTLERHLGPREADYLADPVAERELQQHLDRLVVALPSSGQGGTLADRRPTMRLFLRLLTLTTAPFVVETGCQRADLDYGAGMSSTIFGLFLKHRSGRLVSLDNSPPHVEFCRARMAGLPVEVVLTDSRPWLHDYEGPLLDGLYLDSQDTWESGYQDCCLEEAQAALPHLAPGCPILIDDTFRVAGGWDGKGAKAVPWLLSQGYRVLCDGWQVLLTKS